MKRDKQFFLYIVTNYNKTVLYIGVTNDLQQRITEHYLDRNSKLSFAGKYNAFYLVYYESFQYINDAIARETQLKKWSRIKKDELIKKFNPEWKFLNQRLFGTWPPKNPPHRKDLF